MLILLYRLYFVFLFSFRFNVGSSLVVHYYIFFYVTPVTLLLYFLLRLVYVTPVTLSNKLLQRKNAPGGGLIRVDLIRFPGSIPGGR